MADEKDYGFGRGENILTVVQRTPPQQYVPQTGGTAFSEEFAEAPIFRGEFVFAEPEPVAEPTPQPKREAAKKPAAKETHARAASGPVGPDPKQEAAKSVPAPKKPAKGARR